MTSSIYVFIDESGQASTDGVYAVAGCWTVSHEQDPEQVLKPLRSNVQKHLTEYVDDAPDTISELKGAQLTHVLTDTLNAVNQYMWDDGSVDSDHNYWDTSFPLRFTLCIFENKMLRQTLSADISELNMPTAIKTIGLNAALSPLHSKSIREDGCRDIQILLDATTWARPAQRYKEALVHSDLAEEVTLATRDSKSTPGIQFADLAAYSLRRRFKQGTENKPVAQLENWAF
jgi:hypothetical protein